MNENKEQQMQLDDLQGIKDHSRSVETTTSDGAPVLSKNDELLEMGTAFDFDGFQVVRREFFAHLNEPSVSFNNYKFYVNTACLSKFPETEYVQVLVNRKTKILALRPCEESERDSFLWCNNSKGKRKPKQTTCKLFFAKIVSLMKWNPDYRYKLTGKIIHANGEYLIAFDLTATEVYQRMFPEGAKPKISKTPVFPSEWQDQFGLPFKEHRQSMQINIFDGYAIYAIKDNSEMDGNVIAEQQALVPRSNTGGIGE
jgi:hypothetical protein